MVRVETEGRERFDEQFKGVIDKIKLIPRELSRDLDERFGDDDFEEFDRQGDIVLGHIKESLDALTMFVSANIEIAGNLLKYAQWSKDRMMKKEREGFKKCVERWKRMIEKIKAESEINSYVVDRGGKIVKTETSSIYLYVHFESIEKLEAFMEEYRSGKMAREIQGLVMTEVSRVVISEKNYQCYRRFLGM